MDQAQFDTLTGRIDGMVALATALAASGRVPDAALPACLAALVG